MIDQPHLDSLVELIGKDTAYDIYLEYIDDSRTKIALLQNAWEAKDFSQLRHLSHSLKSASLNMALKDFAKSCQSIEYAATEESEAGIQEIMDKLPDQHNASLAALEAYFQS